MLPYKDNLKGLDRMLPVYIPPWTCEELLEAKDAALVIEE